MATTSNYNDPSSLSASESGALLRAGKISATELILASIERLQYWNTRINAVVSVTPTDQLLQAAKQADARAHAGTLLSLLDGIPLTVKDNLWVQGQPATWGLAALSTFLPDADEPAVSRIRRAGGIITGKTNVPAFALAATTQNTVYGATFNPLDIDLTPGGSSGGAAASVAVGITPFALATDAGGSIRRPASYTGTVGFKPSAGAVESSAGFPRTSLDFQAIGPIARTVEDCALLASLIATQPRLAAFATQGIRPEQTLARISRAKRARILVIEPPAHGQEAEITQALHKAVDHLAQSGHHLQWSAAPYDTEELDSIWGALIASGLCTAIDALRLDAATLPPAMQTLAARGFGMSGAEMYRAAQRLLDFRARLSALWSDIDLILSPSSPCFAWAHGEPYPSSISNLPAGPRSAAIYATFANAVGAPSISLPVITPRLPAGMQLTAAPGCDDHLLAWAWELEKRLGS